MEESDEMREIREYGGDSAIRRELVRGQPLNIHQELDRIAKQYRAVDTAIRMEGDGKQC